MIPFSDEVGDVWEARHIARNEFGRTWVPEFCKAWAPEFLMAKSGV